MKIGIFGGAFDPFHSEHRQIIISAHEALGLDAVVVVPSYAPPHKQCEISPYGVRRQMVEAGTAGLDYVIIDDIEEERGVVNPTSVTLPLLQAKYPADKYYFIMGGDSAVNFFSWISPEKIVAITSLAVAYRSGCGDFDSAIARLRTELNADVAVLPYSGDWVSSSKIKAQAELGLPLDGVCDEVAEIIKNNRLYNRFSETVAKLREDMKETRFRHVASTTVYAMQFSGVLKLKFEDVFLACVLHDCAKHLEIEMEGVPTPVVHQFSGAERARVIYGVTDETILDAIRYHTSGKPNMSPLAKLVYCADKLEYGRDFEGVERLRKIIAEDFDRGFVECVKDCCEHLIAANKPIYILTKECLEYYNRIINH